MIIFVIILLEILVGAEIDLFVPSFPDLQHYFSVSLFQIELTLGLNLTAYCITALFVGSLGDKYGRRPIINLGLIIFIIGSVLCVTANQFWQILLGRILQGAGISGPAVLSYIVIADLYSIKKQTKIMSMLNGIVCLAMAFAPVVGSYTNFYFGWRSNFIILLVFGIICLIASYLIIPHTKKMPEVNLSLKEYIPIIKSKELMLYLFAINFTIIPYMIFVAISPILFIKDLGVSLTHFGFYQGALAATFSLVNIISPFIIKYLGEKKAFKLSIYIAYLFIILCAYLILFNVRDPKIITLVMLTQSISLVIPLNIIWPISLKVVKGAKSRSSAIMLSSRLILTTFFIQIISYWYDSTFFYIGIFILTIFSIGLYFISRVVKIDKII